MCVPRAFDQDGPKKSYKTDVRGKLVAVKKDLDKLEAMTQA